jgi:hypothetical protein
MTLISSLLGWRGLAIGMSLLDTLQQVQAGVQKLVSDLTVTTALWVDSSARLLGGQSAWGLPFLSLFGI